MKRSVLATSPPKRDPNKISLQFPSQRIDMCVWKDAKAGHQDNNYHLVFQPGSLMGRNMPDLLVAQVLAMRRYFFFDQLMPSWVLKLVAQPTHIMIINGVYVRVIWISEADLEELWLYIYHCFRIKNHRENRDQARHILEHPTCHLLSEVCRGRSPVYLQDKNNRGRTPDQHCRLPTDCLCVVLHRTTT